MCWVFCIERWTLSVEFFGGFQFAGENESWFVSDVSLNWSAVCVRVYVSERTIAKCWYNVVWLYLCLAHVYICLFPKLNSAYHAFHSAADVVWVIHRQKEREREWTQTLRSLEPTAFSLYGSLVARTECVVCAFRRIISYGTVCSVEPKWWYRVFWWIIHRWRVIDRMSATQWLQLTSYTLSHVPKNILD